jgi:hypothetical protein
MGSYSKSSVYHHVLLEPAPEGITKAVLVEFKPRDGKRTGELHLHMPDDLVWIGEWSLPKNGEEFRLKALWEDLHQAKRLYEIGVTVIGNYLLGRGKPN